VCFQFSLFGHSLTQLWTLPPHSACYRITTLPAAFITGMSGIALYVWFILGNTSFPCRHDTIGTAEHTGIFLGGLWMLRRASAALPDGVKEKFLDEQAGHDRLAGAGVVSEQQSGSRQGVRKWTDDAGIGIRLTSASPSSERELPRTFCRAASSSVPRKRLMSRREVTHAPSTKWLTG